MESSWINGQRFEMKFFLSLLFFYFLFYQVSCCQGFKVSMDHFTYRNTDTIGGHPLICGKQGVGASSEDSIEYMMDNGQCNTETPNPYILWDNNSPLDNIHVKCRILKLNYKGYLKSFFTKEVKIEAIMIE